MFSKHFFVASFLSAAAIFVLILVAATCFLTSYAFDSLLENFNKHCVFHVMLHYAKVPSNADESLDNYAAKVNAYYDGFKSYNTIPKFREKQNGSFRKYQIDENKTEWGDTETCSRFFYFPIMEIIFAIIWILYILIVEDWQCRSHAATTSWCFVTVEMICLGVSAICCVIYAHMFTHLLGIFRTKITEHFNNAIPYKVLMNKFSLNYHSNAFEPATNFNLSVNTPYVTAFLWLLVAFIMLVRRILHNNVIADDVKKLTHNPALECKLPELIKVKIGNDGLESNRQVYS